MMRVLTDEESVAAADELVKRVTEAFVYTSISHPGVSLDALSQVLWMVNGQNWISVSDLARAKIAAKKTIRTQSTEGDAP